MVAGARVPRGQLRVEGTAEVGPDQSGFVPGGAGGAAAHRPLSEVQGVVSAESEVRVRPCVVCECGGLVRGCV